MLKIAPDIYGKLLARIFIDLDDKKGCWIWTGPLTKKGYGDCSRTWPDRRAHRVSWILHNGEIPDGMCVLHKCDVRSCVNPSHLFLGTIADNNKDCIIKGRKRSLSGQDHPLHKLTENDVLEIRSSEKTHQELADIYGVCRSNITYIKTGRRWKCQNQPG